MKKYNVTCTDKSDISLNDPIWQSVEAADIDVYPWQDADKYAPETKVKMVHGKDGLTLRFDVTEKNIRATFTQPNDPVCRDSCVEFFFTPNRTDKTYLSFEINPLGALLIGYGTSITEIRFLETDRNIFKIEPYLESDKWGIKYFIPYSFISEYYSPIESTFGGNFQKCGDLTDHPHHGCWNLIDTPKPAFHMPQFFGEVVLTR